MQTKITIRNEAQTCYIDIEGTIGVAEEHQFDNASSRVATFEAFRREVARIAEVAATQVVVNIRSTGGDVNDALLIYDALQALDARITTRCYGYTASAATIIAQAADKGCREISSNAMYLIHKSTCSIDGNAESLENRAELLRKTDERLAYLYAMHAGGEVEHFAALMAENNGEGRWLTADEALEAGLADKIIDNLFVGVEIPIPDTEGEHAVDANSSENGEVQAIALAKACDTPEQTKAQTRRAIGRAAHAVIQYLLGRIAYRWDAWMASLEQKREEKLQQKRALKEQKASETDSGVVAAESAAGEAACESATCSSATCGSAEDSAAGVSAAEQSSLPQGKGSYGRSLIEFGEGQRKALQSVVKPTEDPSMARAHSLSNEKAYEDDAKVFMR